MKEIIKYIRIERGISQQQFADELGVAFATVNRWEQGKTKPNELVQKTLYEYSKKYHIDLLSYIINKYNICLHKYNNERKIILFHGSKSGINNDILPISRKQCDFGKGFYMGTEVLQPLTLICNYENPKLYIVEIDVNNLNVLEVPTTIEWALVVAYNRGKLEIINKKNIYNKYKNMFNEYDVVIGNIADDRMFYVLDNFFEGNITDEGLVECLNTLQLGKQFVAITEKACKNILIKEEISLTKLELLCLQDISEKNRRKGIESANEICRNYRRSGKYFDEILGEED